MINGGWLDFYCIGPFHAQEDRLGLDQVRDVFRFHARTSVADEHGRVGRRGTGDRGRGLRDEHRGLAQILAEAHVSVDLVSLATTTCRGFRPWRCRWARRWNPRTSRAWISMCKAAGGFWSPVGRCHRA